MRAMGDEFLERVKERRSKLQIPADSDCESGAESHPTLMHHEIPNDTAAAGVGAATGATIDSIIDDGRKADFKTLPKHLREFAELTTQSEFNNNGNGNGNSDNGNASSNKQCDTIENNRNKNNDVDVATASTMKTESKQIIHKIERCENEDGEFQSKFLKCVQYPVSVSIFTLHFLFILWT